MRPGLSIYQIRVLLALLNKTEISVDKLSIIQKASNIDTTTGTLQRVRLSRLGYVTYLQTKTERTYKITQKDRDLITGLQDMTKLLINEL